MYDVTSKNRGKGSSLLSFFEFLGPLYGFVCLFDFCFSIFYWNGWVYKIYKAKGESARIKNWPKMV
jgi:hypothetical protein